MRMCNVKNKITLIVLTMFLSILTTNVFATNNLILNPDFSEVRNGIPVGWTKEAYNIESTITEFKLEAGEAHSGENYVTIINNEENHARYRQVVKVEPNKKYKLSGWINSKSVLLGKKGANLSIAGSIETSRDIYLNNGRWQEVSMYVETGPEVKEIIVTLNVGGYSSLNKGEASFDNISLVEVDNIPVVASLARVGQDDNIDASQSSQMDGVNENNNIWFLVIGLLILGAGGVIYYINSNKVEKRQEKEEKKE